MGEQQVLKKEQGMRDTETPPGQLMASRGLALENDLGHVCEHIALRAPLRLGKVGLKKSNILLRSLLISQTT